MLVSIPNATRHLSLSMADMLALAVEITMLYRKNVRSISSNSIVVNFNLTFGRYMESFMTQKNSIIELMWTWQLENSSEISGKCNVLLK